MTIFDNTFTGQLQLELCILSGSLKKLGIRFQCHHCEHELHVKDFQAGKRGRCPECEGKFRIPEKTAKYSLAVADKQLVADKHLAGDESSKNSAPQRPDSKRLDSKSKSSNRVESNGEAVEKVVVDEPEQLTEGVVNYDEVAEGPTLAEALPSLSTTNELLAAAPAATWYVRLSSGSQYGPAPNETLLQWLIENRITADSLVWRDGWAEWSIARDVFTDYFPAEERPSSPTAAAPPTIKAAATGNANGSQSNPPLNPVPSLAERNRLERKKKRRRNYILMLSVLTIVAIVLVVALVVVLTQQS